MAEQLNRCFEKHSLQELNSIDIDKLRAIFKFVLQTCDWKGEPIFDVGCNAGSFVRVVKETLPYASIQAFEPHPVLSKKVKEAYPLTHMNEICLSEKNGEATIYIPALSCGISSLVNRPVFQKIAAEGQTIVPYATQTMTLDSFCIQHNIPSIYFLKIDVEGAEKMVLDGARGMLAAHKIRAGVFEVGSTLTDAGTSGDEICKLLESYGYKIHKHLSGNDYVFTL